MSIFRNIVYGFVKKRAARVNVRHLDELSSKADEINSRIAKVPGALRKLVRQVMLLFEMVRDYRSGQYRQVPWNTLAMAVVAIVYFLNPMDVIPDFLFGVGFVDDAIVIGMVMKAIRGELVAYCAHKEYDIEKYF